MLTKLQLKILTSHIQILTLNFNRVIAMEFFNNHNKLFTAAFLLFLGLTIIVCIVPALKNQANNAVLP